MSAGYFLHGTNMGSKKLKNNKRLLIILKHVHTNSIAYTLISVILVLAERSFVTQHITYKLKPFVFLKIRYIYTILRNI